VKGVYDAVGDIYKAGGFIAPREPYCFIEETRCEVGVKHLDQLGIYIRKTHVPPGHTSGYRVMINVAAIRVGVRGSRLSLVRKCFGCVAPVVPSQKIEKFEDRFGQQ
jgi:hypothetical protein